MTVKETRSYEETEALLKTTQTLKQLSTDESDINDLTISINMLKWFLKDSNYVR